MRVSIFLFLIIIQVISFSQKTDSRLQGKLEQTVKGFNGVIGIYVKNIRTGKINVISADTLFPTASMVKVPILIGIMEKINSGEMKYDSVLVYKDSLLYEGEDILGSFKNNEKILLKKLIMLMLTTSDNTASLWLQSLAGKGSRINEIIGNLGLEYTRVNSRTPGRENNRTQYGWGQTTPREMGILFEKIYNNAVFSPQACDRMMRCLGRNYWDVNEAISMVPPYIEVFSKNGCLNTVRNEVLLVNASHNPYILSIFTKNNKDQQWTPENEAWSLARKISKLLWNYFEPKDKWEPFKN